MLSSCQAIFFIFHFIKWAPSQVFIPFVPSRSPYFETVDLPPVHKSDPKFGLQGYTLHFVLHNTDSGIMLGRFRQLSCRTGNLRLPLLI